MSINRRMDKEDAVYTHTRAHTHRQTHTHTAKMEYYSVIKRNNNDISYTQPDDTHTQTHTHTHTRRYAGNSF